MAVLRESVFPYRILYIPCPKDEAGIEAWSARRKRSKEKFNRALPQHRVGKGHPTPPEIIAEIDRLLYDRSVTPWSVCRAHGYRHSLVMRIWKRKWLDMPPMKGRACIPRIDSVALLESGEAEKLCPRIKPEKIREAVTRLAAGALVEHLIPELNLSRTTLLKLATGARASDRRPAKASDCYLPSRAEIRRECRKFRRLNPRPNAYQWSPPVVSEAAFAS